MRYSWFKIIFRHDEPAERNFDIVLIIAILASVTVVMLDSVASVKIRWHDWLFAAEILFTLLFTVEYIIRLSVVRSPWRYATSFFGIIDLLSIIPTFLLVLFPASASLTVVRILRLLRIFRIFKLAEYLGEADVLIQSLRKSCRKILVFIVTILVITVIFGALMYVVEGPENGFSSIPTGMYWAIVTMATVGYGDISPGTPLGRVITAILILIGYSIIAVPTGIYTAELAKTYSTKRKKTSCPRCGLMEHDNMALYCSRCGQSLNGVAE
ncbi:MAG: ion transporter [Arenimonas sp.]